MFTAYMTAVITQGWEWRDGTPCERGSVLFFAGEDSEMEYARRLRGNGADLLPRRENFSDESYLKKFSSWHFAL